MKIPVRLLTLVLLILAATLPAQEVPAELRYELRETREATRKATLAHHESLTPELEAWLAYQLDADFPRTPEDEYYRIISIPLPEGVQYEPGGIEPLGEDRLAVCTRLGDIYLIDGAFDLPPLEARHTLFASGLHETLGLASRDGDLYVVQRGELTRLRDLDGDDRADLFENVGDGWGISGDYHEYAFSSKFDAEGNIWIVLCLTGSFSSAVPYRGWCVRVTPDGRTIPTSSGVRSPGGIGMNAAGDVFYTDNQGPWNGTSILRELRPGAFMGHPGGNRWYDLAPELGSKPVEPKSGSRWHVEMERIPELMTPAVFFPYNKMGKSASGIVTDRSGGKFGPFADQMFVADQTHSTLMRVVLEKVGGFYQGACIPFRKGFRSGNVPVEQAPDGSMFVGGTSRGWGSVGGKPFALERLVWTGKVPFEIHDMKVTPEGFELTFTRPVEPASAGNVESYDLKTYTYIYQSNYGSPEVDHATGTIREAVVSPDGKSVRLVVEGRQIGHIHELSAPGLRSRRGESLLHDVAYYTLFRLPR